MGAGSLRKAIIDGITYNVAADSDPSQTAEELNEPIVHSGGVTKKVTFQHGGTESLDLIVTPIERDQLRLSSKKTKIPMSYTLADGTTKRADGFITLEGYTAQDSKQTIQMFPQNRQWETFSV